MTVTLAWEDTPSNLHRLKYGHFEAFVVPVGGVFYAYVDSPYGGNVLRGPTLAEIKQQAAELLAELVQRQMACDREALAALAALPCGRAAEEKRAKYDAEIAALEAKLK